MNLFALSIVAEVLVVILSQKKLSFGWDVLCYDLSGVFTSLNSHSFTRWDNNPLGHAQNKHKYPRSIKKNCVK